MAYSFAPAHLNKQRAGAVAALGTRCYEDYLTGGPLGNRVQTAREHTPEYLRMSQAERERAKREGQIS